MHAFLLPTAPVWLGVALSMLLHSVPYENMVLFIWHTEERGEGLSWPEPHPATRAEEINTWAGPSPSWSAGLETFMRQYRDQEAEEGAHLYP